MTKGIRICIGIDNGHFAHKGYDHTGATSLTETRVKVGKDTTVAMMGNNAQPSRSYATADTLGSSVTYSCGSFRAFERVNPMTFPEVPISRIALHDAVAQHQNGKYLGHEGLSICTGIPLGRYFKNGTAEVDQVLVDSIKHNLSQPVQHLGRNEAFSLKVEVKPQTFVAWYAYIMEEKRSEQDKSKVELIIHESRLDDPIAIVDVGGGTTDICVIMDGSMQPEFSGSEFVGSNTIRENLEQLIKQKFEMDSVGAKTLDDAITKKSVFLDGKDWEVLDLYRQAYSSAAEALTSFISRKLSKSLQKELKEIRIIGGGSIDFAASLQKTIARSVLVPEPQFENAKGMYLLLRHRMRG